MFQISEITNDVCVRDLSFHKISVGGGHKLSKMGQEERGRYERKKYQYLNKAVTNLNHIPPPGLIKFIPNVHLYVRSAALIEKEKVRHAEKIYEFLKDAYCAFQN